MLRAAVLGSAIAFIEWADRLVGWMLVCAGLLVAGGLLAAVATSSNSAAVRPRLRTTPGPGAR